MSTTGDVINLCNVTYKVSFHRRLG